MIKRNPLTFFLAIAGTICLWLPILAPVFFSLLHQIRAHFFRFDYFLPAEFFPIVLIGASLLLWAAYRARTSLRLIAWLSGVAVGSLILSQVVAVVTGLASGALEPDGWQWILVLALIILYILALVALAVSGLRLLYHLLTLPQSMAKNST